MDTSKFFSLEGRIALITGGSRGIGKMIAAGYIAQGAKVYISSRKAPACEETAAELGPNCIPIPMDVSTVDGCKALAAKMAEHEDHLDILVNNAGAAWGVPFEEFPEQGWDKVMDLNVKSPFFLTQALHGMLKAQASYDKPSKVAIICTSLAPGAFASEMNRAARDHGDEVAKGIPMRRIGTDEDMAGAAIFLASRASDYVVGDTLVVDGGLVNAQVGTSIDA